MKNGIIASSRKRINVSVATSFTPTTVRMPDTYNNAMNGIRNSGFINSKILIAVRMSVPRPNTIVADGINIAWTDINFNGIRFKNGGGNNINVEFYDDSGSLFNTIVVPNITTTANRGVLIYYDQSNHNYYVKFGGFPSIYQTVVPSFPSGDRVDVFLERMFFTRQSTTEAKVSFFWIHLSTTLNYNKSQLDTLYDQIFNNTNDVFDSPTGVYGGLQGQYMQYGDVSTWNSGTDKLGNTYNGGSFTTDLVTMF